MTMELESSDYSHEEPEPIDEEESYSAAHNWLLTLPTAILLLAAIFFGTSAYIHGQLLSVGGQIWDGYAVLRAFNLPKPNCDPNINIDKRVQEIVAQSGGGGLLSMGSVDPAAVRQSLKTKQAQCRTSIKQYHYYQHYSSTWQLQAYRAIERFMGKVATIGANVQTFMLVLLILFGGLSALIYHEQISLRLPESVLDYRLSAGIQFIVTLFLAASSLRWLITLIAKTGDVYLYGCWVVCFGALAIASAYRFFKIPEHAKPGGTIIYAFLTVPLYCYLGIIAIIYFLFIETYLAGAIIQVHMMISFADLYTAIGLFVWIGMMLKHTRLAELMFDIIHFFRLKPEYIVMVVVILAAWPTAYTGASGIFVMAAGAVIYQQLRVAGARRQISVAATAMSGSMGVVLAPCLMIVIISALNRQVTTTQLYGWGIYVYILTAVIFAIYIFLTSRNAPKSQDSGPADTEHPGLLRALVPVIPYVVIAAIVLVVYTRLIGVEFTAFSAPIILPLIMLFLLIYDRLRAKHHHRKALEEPARDRRERDRAAPAGFWNAMRAATADTSMLMGALLTLMVLSVIFGGVAGRSNVMSLFPDDMGNVWLAMAILLVFLVIMGMIMDPYGAIILVSATIAPIAYSNGIAPVHFWMLVLVAFELGYLTPPVALNQLLTRMVIGKKEIDIARQEVAGHPSFYRRYESWILPLITMFTSLMIVAWAPLIYTRLF